MEALKEDMAGTEITTSAASFQRFMDSQKDLFHSQVDQLQRIVVTQCQLTGVNPLSQEMAAGALSIKIGKRPRDLLNPKAIKYMQAVFSIKDAITKKESREISAQFGITVTKVREFFTSQRSRVRRLVRLVREKGIRDIAVREASNNIQMNGDSTRFNSVPLNSIIHDPVPVSSIGSAAVISSSVGLHTVPLHFNGPNPVPLTSAHSDTVPLASVGSDHVPLNSLAPDSSSLMFAGPSDLEGGPSFSKQEDILPGLDDSEKHFVENIFGLLKKEETFGGQVKLLEWVLQIQNLTVLNWFLSKGGVMILATWLTLAAAEEQTSVLLVALRVLLHLPLHNACPEHMSAVLHSVNTLRFYRTSDISNRARILLSKWTKMFARSQSAKKPNGIGSSTDAQDMILKRSIDEIMSNEFWHPDIGYAEGTLALPSDHLENVRKMESSQTMKLLPASTEDASRKHILGGSPSHARERRKVQLVEQPGQKASASRTLQGAKALSFSQGRPMSADDIQKAKLRALYMQSKHGRKSSLPNGSNSMNNEAVNKGQGVLLGNSSQVSKVVVEPKDEELKEPVLTAVKVTDKGEDHHHATEAKMELKVSIQKLESEVPVTEKEPKVPVEKMESKVPVGQLHSRVQIPWQSPPEVRLNLLWRVGTGEFSKEVEVQKNRNRREMEIIYRVAKEIPSNPKEPWDLDMDYDDSLTPEIPIEQQPDAADGTEKTEVPDDNEPKKSVAASSSSSSPAGPTIVAQNGDGGGPAAEPDLELLAVLLKNPQLVFALTSGQAGNLSNDETMKLLDMIKSGGSSIVGSSSSSSVNESGGGKVERAEVVEVSLPSPTPSSSNPRTSGWKPEVAKNPFSQQNQRGRAAAYLDTTIVTSSVLPDTLASTSSMRSLPLELPNVPLQPSHHHQQQQYLRHHQSTPNYPELQTPGGNASSFVSMGEGPQVRFQQQRQTFLSESSPQVLSSSYLSSRPGNVNVGRVPAAQDSWIARQGVGAAVGSNSYSNVIHQSVYSGTSTSVYRRNEEYYRGEGFESWSPENSPSRSRSPGEQMVMGRGGGGGGYVLGGGRRAAAGYRDTGIHDNHRQTARPRNPSSSSSVYRDPNDNSRVGNGRWR
ncbi:unnamed protein product [Linum tenue]|uniref:Homeobox domain-containing protein n=3 Tax=Linum tenue TaxID=586396 RepID=A0AAV0MMW6_9ROSI|nr:unnamed protein product [Linum tenue]